MPKTTYQIPNISCNHCVHTIETELNDLPGVESVIADPSTKTAVVEFQPPATEDLIIELLKEINYPARQ